MQVLTVDLTRIKLDPLPILSPCYCDDCKSPLTASRVLDDRNAWCPKCKSVVATSWFQVPGWIIGVTVILFAVVRLLF